MLRLITILSGAGLIVAGIFLLMQLLADRYAEAIEVAICFAMIVGGACSVGFAAKPSATASDRLLTAWMELKREEMIVKRNRIKADDDARG